jgi:TusA-related sulfurtransferase
MKYIYKLYTNKITCLNLIIKINNHIKFLKQNESILIISKNILFIIEIKTFILKNDIILSKWDKNKKQYILIKYKKI